MQDFARDLDYIKTRFDCCPETGVLTWKSNYEYPAWWNTKYAGKSPKATDKFGYLRAKITRVIDGKKISKYVSCHRICFLIHNGWLPEVVDHIDGDVTNNRANNLRAADSARNAWNRVGNKGTATGYKGVSIIRQRDKVRVCSYVGSVTHNGKSYYLGSFKTAEQARDAVIKKENELREFWVRK